MVHPKTGQKLLFVNEMETDHIAGIAPQESEELIEALFADMYRPEHVLEHWWNEGDLVIWDNLAVQHGRGNVNLDGPERTLRKVFGPMSARGTMNLRPKYSKVSGS